MFIQLLKRILLLLTLTTILSSCDYDDGSYGLRIPEGEVTGLKPIYLSEEEITDIRMDPPQPVIIPGKILVTGQYLLINEKERGIHIINNADPKDPKKVAFLKIPGNIDVSIKDNYIYADNYSDLVTLEITSDTTVKETHRIKDVFTTQDFPPFSSFSNSKYFECPDSAKGVVIGWQETKLIDPKCYR